MLAALPGLPLQKYSLKCLCRNHEAAAFYRACGFVEAGVGVGEDGDYVVFEAIKPVIMIVSSCPQDILPINSGQPVEFDVEVSG